MLLLGSPSSESFRVLGVFPHPAVSHFRAFQPLLRELAERGHDVTVVSYFPDETAPANYRDLVLHERAIVTDSLPVDEVS